MQNFGKVRKKKLFDCMSWKLKYRCKACGYEAEMYEGRGLFRQQITPMYCPDCKTIQNIVVGGIIAEGAHARQSASKLALHSLNRTFLPPVQETDRPQSAGVQDSGVMN